MSVFEYSFFLLVGFIPIYNLVCVILKNNQNDFEKLNIKINMLIYSNEQLKTKIENIISEPKNNATVAVEESSPVVEESSPAVVEESSPVVEESSPVVEESSPVVEESSPAVVEESSPAVVEETPAVSVVEDTLTTIVDTASIIDTSIDDDSDDSDIDFVKDRVKNDKASQNLSYFITSKLTNISSSFF
jgi:hypothetical protein